MKINKSIRQVLWISAAIIICAQININLFIADFKVSVGIILFPFSLIIFGKYPIFPTTLLSAFGVWFSRVLVYWIQFEQIELYRFFPEMVFYLVFGLLFSLFCHINGYSLSSEKIVCLFLFDYSSNLCELLFRLGPNAFSVASQSSILLVAFFRAIILWCIYVGFHHYKFSLLRQEHVQRYQRLLLLISKLNGEVVWMKKNTHLIEETMSKSYQLFQSMQDQNIDPKLSQTALDVAKDIHEVKKEYLLILRGLSEALDLNLKDEGMHLSDILQILKESLKSSYADQKEIDFSYELEEDIYTTKHYFLMSIFRNLFNNAVEASKNDVVHLQFKQYSTKDTVHFDITDDGPGISEENMSMIFSPGFSTKINYSTGEINRGLGLNLVKDLIENQWNGKIYAESEPGHTVFYIKLPKSNEGSNF